MAPSMQNLPPLTLSGGISSASYSFLLDLPVRCCLQVCSPQWDVNSLGAINKSYHLCIPLNLSWNNTLELERNKENKTDANSCDY